MEGEFVFVFLVAFALGVAFIVAVALANNKLRGVNEARSGLVLKGIGWLLVLFGLGALCVPFAWFIASILDGGIAPEEAAAICAIMVVGLAVFLAGVWIVRVAEAVHGEPSDAERASLSRSLTTLNYIGWTIIGLLLGGLLLASLGTGVLFLLPLSALLVGSLVLPIVLVMTAAGNRRGRQGQLLWLLATAIEKQIPLPEEIDAYAETLGGRRRRQALELADNLRDGMSVPDALTEASGAVPAFAIVSARVGVETGTLGQALREAAVRHTAAMQPATFPSVSSFLVYYWAVIAIAIGIVSFQMYYIIPKFKKIFADFGTELPDVTVWLIRISSAVVEYFVLWLPILALPFVGLVVALVGHHQGWANLSTPWITKHFPRFDTPWILRHLAWIVSKGHPLGDGLTSICSDHHRAHIRERIERVATVVATGNDCWKALENQGLLRPHEWDILEAAQRLGNLPWALTELADTMERRQHVRLLYWFEALRPVAVISIGLMVAFVVIGLFMPIVKLINDLS